MDSIRKGESTIINQVRKSYNQSNKLERFKKIITMEKTENNPVNIEGNNGFKSYKRNIVVILSRFLGLDPLFDWKDPFSWLSAIALLFWIIYSSTVMYSKFAGFRNRIGVNMRFTTIHLVSVMIFAALTLFQVTKFVTINILRNCFDLPNLL